MRKTTAGALLAIGMVALSGCATYPAASTLPDGQYAGSSQPETDGTVGKVRFTIKGGQVVDAEFRLYDKDGTIHDENYGKTASGTVDTEFYQRAQDAISAEQRYVQQFQKTGDQNQVDRVAGASLSHRLFLDAVQAAMDTAQK